MSKHNHIGAIEPEGKCPRCDEWWRWHRKVAPPVEKITKPTKPKKRLKPSA